jgi:signal transduction histidine kinase
MAASALARSATVAQAERQGRGFGLLITEALVRPLYRQDLGAVRDIARGVRTRDGVRYFQVYDGGGRLFSRRRGDEFLRPRDFLASDLVVQARERRGLASRVNHESMQMIVPALVGSQIVGYVRFVYRLEAASGDIEALDRQMASAIVEGERKLFMIFGAIALVALALVVGLSVLLARNMVRPIKALAGYSRRIGAGNYDDPLPITRSDEIGELARELGEMAQDLKQAAQVARLATLGEMAVGMAHELSQPPNTIRLAADNALYAIEDESAGREFEIEKLKLISDQAASLGNLIQRMCVVGRDEGPTEIIDPREAIEDAVSLLQGQFTDEGIAIKVDANYPCPLVHGRRNELGQVIMNLLTNARDAILGSILARPDRARPVSGRIEIDFQEDGPLVCIGVKDNGGGVPDDVMDRVFDPFFTTKAVTKGTGLGLSISYGIVNSMGGRMVVENTGGGAKFTVCLPRAGAETAVDPEHAMEDC